MSKINIIEVIVRGSVIYMFFGFVKVDIIFLVVVVVLVVVVRIIFIVIWRVEFFFVWFKVMILKIRVFLVYIEDKMFFV